MRKYGILNQYVPQNVEKDICNYIFIKIQSKQKISVLLWTDIFILMINIIHRKTVYQTFNDKHNDNVICYDDSEVLLCR